MKRASLSALSAAPYDILVVGGGIYGAMTARDAALRGLRTALVERDDFGGATSYNSLKVMHGGIRYVQHLDFARLRASAREQAFWQRAAPALVRPREFVIPLTGHGMKGPEVFAVAAALYRAASAGLRAPGYGAAGVVASAEARRRMGRLAPPGLTGGGVWHDGQILDANRLLLAGLEGAAGAGADLANRVEATELLARDGAVAGARLRDRTTGTDARVEARVVISCTGSAGAALARPVLPPEALRRFPGFVRATNLVLDRVLCDRGVGAVSRSRSDAVVDRGGRMYFFLPWEGKTLVGTHEAPAPADGALPPARDRGDVEMFLSELAHACPDLGLKPEDVVHVYQGLIPADVDDSRGARRQTRGTLVDHAQEHGVGGLISLAGVKYTTARLLAERAVDRAALQLGRAVAPSSGLDAPLPEVGLAACDPDDPAALRDRVARAVREEMALGLDDLLFRRTRIAETGGLIGEAGRARLEAAARIMAAELGWTPERIRRERDAVARLVADGAAGSQAAPARIAGAKAQR